MVEKTASWFAVKFQSSVGVVEVGTLAKGTIGSNGLDIKLEENTKNDTDKTRVNVTTAAIGIEYRFNFEGRRSGG
jgi:hypothetical protein